MSDHLVTLAAIGGHEMEVYSFAGPSKEIGLCLQFNVGRDWSQLTAVKVVRLHAALSDWLETFHDPAELEHASPVGGRSR